MLLHYCLAWVNYNGFLGKKQVYFHLYISLHIFTNLYNSPA